MSHSRIWVCAVTVAVLVLLVNHSECIPRNPYKVLGVRRSGTQREITQAFRRLSRQYHPDKNPSKDATAKFQEISAAYDYLTDPSRQQQPWEWDFGDPEPSPKRNRRRNKFGAEAAYDVFQNSYEFVLDLDPVRMWQLARSWIEHHIEKHRLVLEPLWHGSVDRSVCQALESGWKLPQLLEPALLLAAKGNLLKYDAGQWRAWVGSGLLLELSFWVGRQTPCLQHHSASHSTEAPAAADVEEVVDPADPDLERLIQLQQQLHTQRRLRQQLLHSSNASRSKNHSRHSSSSSSSGKGGSIVLDGFDVGSVQLQLLQGRLMWWSLLLLLAYLLRRDRQLVAVGCVLVGFGLWSVYGGMASTEPAVQALEALLESGSWQGWLVGCSYVAAYLSTCLLLPLVLAGCAVLAATWLWAAVSCVSIAGTPCLSRLGFALWIALQLWNLSRGELLRGAGIGLCIAYIVYKRPGILLWWIHLLFSPVLFVYYLLHIFVVLQLVWWGLYKPRAAAKQRNVRQDQQQVQQAAGGTAQQQQQEEQQQQQQRSQGSARTTADRQHSAAGEAVRRAGAAQVQTSTSPGAAAAAAAAAGMPAGSTSKPSVGRRVARGAVWTIFAIFKGPWWPASFNSIDLASTCHWWVRLLGWNLPCRALHAAAISCKLTFAVAAAVVAMAAFGVPAGWLTVRRLMQVVLLRVGLGMGGAWVLFYSIDDVVQFLNPSGYHKHKRRQLLEERAKRVQQEMLRVQQQKNRQLQQQQ